MCLHSETSSKLILGHDWYHIQGPTGPAGIEPRGLYRITTQIALEISTGGDLSMLIWRASFQRITTDMPHSRLPRLHVWFPRIMFYL